MQTFFRDLGRELPPFLTLSSWVSQLHCPPVPYKLATDRVRDSDCV